jgi:hypothetical protein
MKEILFMGSKTYRPGEIVPISAQYGIAVYDNKANRWKIKRNKINCIEGKRFPPYKKPRVQPLSFIGKPLMVIPKPELTVYFLKDKTKHIY